SCFQDQFVIMPAQLPPTTRQHSSHPIERSSNAKPGSGIECTGPIETILKRAVSWPRRVVAVTNNRWLDSGLFVFAHPKKTCAFGRANPFVQIAGVIRRAQFRHLERQHAWRVRAI